MDDSVGFFICSVEIHGAAGHAGNNRGLSDCQYRINQFALRLRQQEAQLIAACEYIGGVAFLAFQEAVEADHDKCDVCQFRHDLCLYKTVVGLGQMLDLFAIQMAALRDIDTRIREGFGYLPEW